MPGRTTTRDARLLALIARGDERAWETLDDRHRRGLRRYAASLSRPGTIEPDDVVQDVLIRAHAALRDGFVPDHLDAWLHRMVRNAAIDAIRARRPAAPLEDHDPADRRGDPELLTMRRERLRRIVDDVARLPDAQRRALLGRAVDGRPVDEVAAELGLSGPAVHMAVRRARENLMRSEGARDALCEEIRPLLHEANERGSRPSEHARLHLQECTACRAYRRDLRRTERRLRSLAPPVLPVLGVLGGATQLGAGAKTAGVIVGAAVVTATTGGVLVVAQRTVGPGQAAPATLVGQDTLGGTVRRGRPLPRGMFVVRATVRVAAGVPARGTRRSVTLTCPPNTAIRGHSWPRQRRYAGPRLEYGLFPDRTATARSRRVFFAATRLERPQTFQLDAVCRPTGADGTTQRRPRRPRPGEAAARICDGAHYARKTPTRHGVFVGTLYPGQPVSVPRLDRTRRWASVVPDAGYPRGWVRRSELC